MGIRVTQRMMYGDMVSRMQKSLSDYMVSNEQGATQKRINRPSDDPAGTYRVLTCRNKISDIEQLKTNTDTALGWLQLADNVLATQVPNAIIGLKTLAEQASTGTYTADQRRLMADEARAYFGQLLNLANTEFEGRQLFAGHRYDSSAFVEGLAVTSWDETWAANNEKGMISVSGTSSESIIVQFMTAQDDEVKEGTKYRWTNDGGKTWKEEVVGPLNQAGNLELNCDGVIVTLSKIDADKQTVTWTTDAYDESLGASAKNGTTLYIRPGAFYQGDDKDPPPDITVLDGPTDGDGNSLLKVDAYGEYASNLLVRFDTVADLNTAQVSPQKNEEFTWSYSTDGGSNWITVKGTTTDDGLLRLPVPGGYIDFDATGVILDPAQPTANIIPAGTQIMVHPSRADLDYEILEDTHIAVNSVGKDVFGGIYLDEYGQRQDTLKGDDNLLEVVGAFIGYLEGNNQEGCQRTLAALTQAEKQILAEAARIGGLENRVSLAQDVISFQELDQEERLSYVEDIDLTELLTKLTRQQLTYQTVLQSSSMIMNLSLANYI